jgi:hypothetical protein
MLVDRDDNVLFVEKNFFDKDEKIIENTEGQWFRFTFRCLNSKDKGSVMKSKLYVNQSINIVIE